MTAPHIQRVGRRSFLKVASLGATVAVTSCATDDDADSSGGHPGSSTTHPTADSTATSASPTTAQTRVPSPVALARTRWATDPWTFGSYSFLGVGATPQLREALVKPIAERIFFAGEATSSEAPSTVHGALASGLDAASAVLEVAEPGERVLVVGAGISGVAAANKLADAGFDPIIYEATDRIGGRIRTVAPGAPAEPSAEASSVTVNGSFSVPIELGASWVHDIAASEVAERLTDLEVQQAPFDYEQRLLVSAPAKEIDVDTAQSQGSEVLDAAVDWASKQDDDTSLAAAIDAVRGEHPSVSESVLDWFESTEIATEYGADAAELSAYWGLEEGTEGEDQLVLGGYIQLVENLANDLRIETDRPVQEIRLAEDELRVSTVGGTESATADETFDRVIVSVPLGVLQKDLITFDPSLPDEKLAAIDKIGMGLLDKYWFEFDEQFWSEETPMWTWLNPQDNPFDEWFNLAPATGQAVLLALVGGEAARSLETKSDDEITALAQASLQAFIDAGW